MKNKKGFTLIELLAVIVILAIIALIATPIILNMINEARKSSAKSAALGYIDAIEYNNGFAQLEKAGYTEITGDNVDVTTIDIKLKGKKPDSGTITVNNKGKVASASDLCFNGYKVDYDGKDVTLDGKCSSSSNNNQEPQQPSIPEPVSFESDSWATIAANTTSNKYHVGDEKTIQMDVDGDNTAEEYHIMIVNMSPCTTETSETACGMVLQFKELLNITNNADKKMNLSATNVGGWPASKMRIYLNDGDSSIYNKLKAAIGNIIIDTTVISGYGMDDNNNQNFITQDKLYLLSTKEVGFNESGDSIGDETRNLDYYISNSTRTKYNYGTTTKFGWWLRSATTGSANNFYYVNNYGGSGGGYYQANTTYGVAPAFRIGLN